MKSHKEEFNKWSKERNIELFDKLSDVMPDCKVDLQVGQKCTFVNYCMVDFSGRTIMGFCKPTSWGACVYLDSDSYWHPTSPENIFLDGEFGKNGIIEMVKDKDCIILIINRIRCVVQSYKVDEWVNLSPVQTGRETFDERLDNIRIDLEKNEISTEGKKSVKWNNFTLSLDPMRINEMLKKIKI
ncbi:MAG: hypothetical protein LBI60_02730 [Bacteroidales bacterium]|jgi:hypothetical protein|nr:hypothetical protein [Bacteroidales bacterium]